MSNWFKANKLSLNTSKTNFILFNSAHRRLPTLNIDVKIDGVQIKRVQTCKFHGITINENLTWKPHMQSVEKHLSRNIGLIKRIRFKICSHKNISLLLYIILNYFVAQFELLCLNYLVAQL